MSQTVPLMLLIGPDTEGSPEIFAAALQSTGRARLIGMPTPGAVEGFTEVPLPDGSRMFLAPSSFRTQHNVDHHALTALMATRKGALFVAPEYSLPAIVDRIGAGDAFAAGVLHGLYSEMSEQDALHFGLASACLKHSQPGDFSLADEAEIAALVAQQGFDVRR